MIKLYILATLKKILIILTGFHLISNNDYQYYRKILRRNGEVIVAPNNYFNKSIYVNVTDIGVGHQLILRNEYEKSETTLLKKVLKKGETFIDVGANIGYFSVIASELVGERGTVYAFEPDSYNFSLLQKNLQRNNCKNVEVMKKAVGNLNGTINLFTDFNNLGNHNQIVNSQSNSMKVPIVSLDSILFSKFSKNFLLKIDIQGTEIDVLNGAKKIIKKYHPRIIIELCPSLNEESGKKSELIPLFLRKNGYDITIIKQNSKKLKIENSHEIVEYARLNGYINLFATTYEKN